MIQQTSLEAFAGLVEGDKLPKCRQMVLDGLRVLGGCATNMMVAQNIGWSINRVTPRMNELCKAGIVQIGHKKPCFVTKNGAIWWVFT